MTNRDIARLKMAVTQANAIVALEGFSPTPFMEQLNAALIANKATSTQQGAYVLLRNKLRGARNVISGMSQDDPRLSELIANYKTNFAAYTQASETMGITDDAIQPLPLPRGGY